MTASIGGFEAYLESHPGLKPIMHFGAYALRARTPPSMGWGYLPSGDVLLYPEWLVFLSLHKEDTRNWIEHFAGDASEEVDALRCLSKWVANPATFLIDVVVKANELQKGEKAFWEMSKENKHSLFWPLNTIKSVETGNIMLQGQFVKVESTMGDVIICENLDYENFFEQVKTMFGGKWQPDFIKELRDAVIRNSH